MHRKEGTDVWRATFPDGTRAVVKRVERSYIHAPELLLMEQVRGERGFVQLEGTYHDARGALCLVMPEYPGDLLTTILESADGLPVADARSVASSVAPSLVHLHERLRALHLDVKPDNLLADNRRSGVRGGGGYLLGDFGCALSLPPTDGREPAAVMVADDETVGTPAYAPPEMGDDSGRPPPYRLTEKSDAYSLGATLFATITRRTPHTRDRDALVRDMLDRCESRADERFVSDCVGGWLEPDPERRATVRSGIESVSVS